eukprot:UN29293
MISFNGQEFRIGVYDTYGGGWGHIAFDNLHIPGNCIPPTLSPTTEPTSGPTTTPTTEPTSSPTAAPTPNCQSSALISGQDSDFEGGMAGWTCYDDGNGFPHGNCHVNLNYQGHTSSGHIHGNCDHTQGGIEQTFQTTSGTFYNLRFLAHAGHVDGVDDVYVRIVNSDVSSLIKFEVNHGSWEVIEIFFMANGPVNIVIFADIGHCIDVDDITLDQCLTTKTPTANR